MTGRILILTDGKAGHENQSKALARALGREFDLVGVKFKSPWHKALSYVADRLGLACPGLYEFAEGCDGAALSARGYAAVIGTGSGTFYAVKTLARRLAVKGGVVLYPRGYRLSSFDCILSPSFDRPRRAANIIEIPANLVAADEDFYAKGVAAFAAHRGRNGAGSAAERGAVAVIIGGPNKCATMTREWMRSQIESIFRENAGASPAAGPEMWVTTSRRTPPEIEALLDEYPWDYKLIYSRDRFNPIPAFVKLARRLYVTAESTGMISEACTSGTAEVQIIDNLKPGRHKFRRFVEDLAGAGYLRGARKIDLSAQFAAARKLLGL